jgi:hypothetical protein
MSSDIKKITELEFNKALDIVYKYLSQKPKKISVYNAKTKLVNTSCSPRLFNRIAVYFNGIDESIDLYELRMSEVLKIDLKKFRNQRQVGDKVTLELIELISSLKN